VLRSFGGWGDGMASSAAFKFAMGARGAGVSSAGVLKDLCGVVL